MPDNRRDTGRHEILSEDSTNRILHAIDDKKEAYDRNSNLLEKTSIQLAEIAKELPNIRTMQQEQVLIKSLVDKNEQHTLKHCKLLEGEDGIITRLILLETAYNNRWTSPDRVMSVMAILVAVAIAIFKK